MAYLHRQNSDCTISWDGSTCLKQNVVSVEHLHITFHTMAAVKLSLPNFLGVLGWRVSDGDKACVYVKIYNELNCFFGPDGKTA